jgi:aminoglycoside 3-N-acetyltransferase
LIRTSQSDLSNLFKALRIPVSGTVMLHAALFSLGLIEGGVKGFYDALRKHLGEEGTIIVPTFSYSYRRNEIYDVEKTPSAKSIGIFSEYVRKKIDSVRSLDPMFSMAAIGPMASSLMERKSKASFGPDSIYEELFNHDAIFIGIGITYSTGLTGFIHLEKLSDVPYRQDLVLRGRSRLLDGSECDDYAIHYARNEDFFINAQTNRESMGALLESCGVSTEINYGYSKHMSLSGPAWQEIVVSELKKDPFCMLQFNSIKI